MGLFDSISSVFSSSKTATEQDQSFENEANRLFEDLENRFSISEKHDKAAEVIENFTKLSSDEKKNQFISTYLKVEKTLSKAGKGGFKKAQSSLRNYVKSKYPKLRSWDVFSLVLEPEEKQEVLLCKLFILNVVGNVKDLLGDSGSTKIQDIKSFVEATPEKYVEVGTFDFVKRKPANLRDWAKVLRKLASYTFITLSDKIGDQSTIVRFEKEYQKLADQYSELDSFQIIISILPDEILDESKLGTLNKKQIELLLQKKADYFERLTDQLAQKNKELEKAQQNLIKAKESAEQASRTKAMFLANMSHEIRTPMNAVIGMTDILRETNLTKEQLNYVDTISRSGNDLITIINDILDYSKIESGNLSISEETTDLYSLTEDIMYMLALKAHEKNLEILYQIEKDVPVFIKSDPVRLKQVLVNLINNAIKFTNQGFVRVHISAEHLEGQKGKVTFRVKDTGIGIDKNQLDNIFKSFTQVDLSSTKKFEGTGLGLTISQTIVKLMGGTIKVESSPNKGSEFYFSIDTEFEHNTEKEKTKPDFKGLKTGFASHSAVLMNDTERLFRSWNLECETFQDSISLERSIDNGDKFDFLVLDHNFIQYCDDSTLQKIDKLQKNDVPAILIYPLGANIERKYLDQFEIRLTKPIKQSELISEIRSFSGIESEAVVKPLPKKDVQTNLLSILVVEDNITNQVVLKSLLTKLGYTPKFANNGMEALEQLKAEKFELIFMDMQMPVLDGIEATKEIRQKNELFNEPTIVALTANAMQEDREKCLKAGMDDYLSKPVKKDEILNTINKWFPNQ